MAAKIPSEYLEGLAVSVKNILQQFFQKTGRLTLPQEPALQLKDIVEYDRRMRVNALEKFNGPGYVAAINFYKNQKDKDVNHSCGALIIYINEKSVGKTLEATGFEKFNEDDSEVVIDRCCQLCEKTGAEFVKQLAAKGYQGLVTSEAIGNRNTIPQGVDFSYDQYDKYEVSFPGKDFKILIADITMAVLK